MSRNRAKPEAIYELLLQKAIELSRQIAVRLEDLQAKYPSEPLREAMQMQFSRNEHIGAQPRVLPIEAAEPQNVS
jgi:hypothetical protein